LSNGRNCRHFFPCSMQDAVERSRGYGDAENAEAGQVQLFWLYV
jgi:hypothetical protein